MDNGVGESGSKLIYSVSQLNDKIKELLEESFPFIWITGEISNFSSPMSGHFYFSLKDANAQISAVMFRGQNRNLKFEPKNGMAVTGLGRISLYKPRGTYQIIFEYIEPQGIGALQVAYEQLKAKLSDEGLFDAEKKTPLPFLPGKIALITSPSGAVLHDMIKIARRRFENMQFLVIPSKVQGIGAIEEIVQAICLLNRTDDVDVAILARGGGSLEDLQAFNSESVARAIAGSHIPIVSAVGHETDYTISDFTADLRAPTPSAAVEIVVPQKAQLLRQLSEKNQILCRNMDARLRAANSELKFLAESLADPVRRMQDMKMRCDELTTRMFHSFQNMMVRRKEHLLWRSENLFRTPFLGQLFKHSKTISKMNSDLLTTFRHRFEQLRYVHHALYEKLYALSPLSVLDRGYSITRTVSEKQIIRRSDQVDERQHLEIILSNGGLNVSVNKKIDPGFLPDPPN